MGSTARYRVSVSALAFRPAVQADGARPVSGGPVLLLDVLPRDGNGAPPADPAEQDPVYSRFARQ
jgi:hypothetical protein